MEEKGTEIQGYCCSRPENPVKRKEEEFMLELTEAIIPELRYFCRAARIFCKGSVPISNELHEISKSIKLW